MTTPHVLTYEQEIAAWHKQRDADLRTPDGWLSLTGLFILSEGTHKIGSHPSNDILLPASTPFRLGELEFHNQQATLHVTTDVAVLVDGVPVRRLALADNSSGKPTIVNVGTVLFFVHHFAGQYAVRVKDTAGTVRVDFEGNSWFPVNRLFRLHGKFTRYEQTRPVPINTIHNYPSEFKSAGEIAFEFNGQKHVVLASEFGKPNRLNIAFRDQTSGRETYGPVRFLIVDVDDDGNVDLDFNRAVNPPCAFTPFATCPLAPQQNVLPITIEAGELYSQAVIDIYNRQLPREAARA